MSGPIGSQPAPIPQPVPDPATPPRPEPSLDPGLPDALRELLARIRPEAVVGNAPTDYTSTVAPQAVTNDGVLFVGMNPDSRHEMKHLQGVSSRARFDPVFNGREPGQITIKVQGQPLTCDLTTDAGINAFTASLGLPPEQAEAIGNVFRNHRSFTGALDELAQIAQVWARAERGGTIPSRMVISGHSNGSSVWGDGNGNLTQTMLRQLACAMPAAAAQVEDLAFSACNSGGEHNANVYREVFPNLKTFMAYEGSAPGTWSGAMPHLARWERATRGRTDDIDPQMAAGTRKGDHIATWDAADGYESQGGGDPLPFPIFGGGGTTTTVGRLDPQDLLNQTQATFDRYFSGELAVTDTQSGPLRERYDGIQRALRHPGLADDQRRQLESARDQTIKLIFYTSNVAPRFAETYGEAVQAGFKALGLAVPDFAGLSRAEALEVIHTFEQALSARENPPQAALDLLPLLTQGLRDLGPAIPIEWV